MFLLEILSFCRIRITHLSILIEMSFRLSNVTLETAIFISGSKNDLATGVEVCKCPDIYEGTSCQNPADGYYRYKEPSVDTSHSDFNEYIGISVPCECNGRSNQCDRETGHCKVCDFARFFNL